MVLKFREIPANVWQAVRDKWVGVLANGWQDNTWSRCAMCEFMDAYVHGDRGCDICPLDAVWCGGAGCLFLPQYEYRPDKWGRNVVRFVRMCDKIIKKQEGIQ